MLIKDQGDAEFSDESDYYEENSKDNQFSDESDVESVILQKIHNVLKKPKKGKWIVKLEKMQQCNLCNKYFLTSMTLRKHKQLNCGGVQKVLLGNRQQGRPL